MDISPHILTAKVFHHRLFPQKNRFAYRAYYVALPLPAPAIGNRLLYLDKKDLGYRDGQDPGGWAKEILKEYDVADKVAHIVLVTMPRVLGYVFNPVSFYFCLDTKKNLRAVIAEVHNTFGEQHAYLCAHPDGKPIQKQDWLEAEKVFHVSPFLERSGHYRFRFALDEKKLGVWIDYFDKTQKKQLVTSLVGHMTPLERGALRRVFWRYPWVTLKTIVLIHWQALRLFFKRARYMPKPVQKEKRVSSTHHLTKK